MISTSAIQGRLAWNEEPKVESWPLKVSSSQVLALIFRECVMERKKDLGCKEMSTCIIPPFPWHHPWHRSCCFFVGCLFSTYLYHFRLSTRICCSSCSRRCWKLQGIYLRSYQLLWYLGTFLIWKDCLPTTIFQGYVRLWGCRSLVLRNLHKNGTIKSLHAFCLVKFNKVDMKWTMNHPRWDSEFFAVFAEGSLRYMFASVFLNFQPAVSDWFLCKCKSSTYKQNLEMGL